MLKIMLMAALAIIFIKHVQYIKKEYQKSPHLTKPKWYKLYFEFLIVNIINFVGMWILLAHSTSPWLFLILGITFSVVALVLYYIYGSLRASKKFFGGIEYLIAFNKLYKILVIINIAAILLKIL